MSRNLGKKELTIYFNAQYSDVYKQYVEGEMKGLTFIPLNFPHNFCPSKCDTSKEQENVKYSF